MCQYFDHDIYITVCMLHNREVTEKWEKLAEDEIVFTQQEKTGVN